MARIVYYAFPNGEIQGGQKMILRHVEALRAIGFDAVCWVQAKAAEPGWLSHSAPIVRGTGLQEGDVLVLPDDAGTSIGQAARLPHRTVIFAQNQFTLAAIGLPEIAGFPPGRTPPFIVVGRILADAVRRLFPEAQVEIVPCFADERLFRPGDVRDPSIAFAPRKRPREATIIRQVFRSLHPRHAPRGWREIHGLSEVETARTMAASELFLSLSRFESVGMTTLEAMASGCLCAGFLGVGGQEYATAENGFWVADDDCYAAADALALAADVAASGGKPRQTILDAGRATAAQWSRARFMSALEETWMRLAPEARLRQGPLDPV